jgi:hypothetical protein
MAFLTPPPAAPQRGDRTTFANRVDAFITWLINFVGELIALVSGLNILAAGGAYAFSYTVDVSSTTDSDPTPGKLRFNAATQNAATSLFLDLFGSDGIDNTAMIDQLDASTSAVKGQIRIVKLGDPTKFLTFDVTARTTATGYRKLTVVSTGGSSASPFAANDSVLVKFTRTGDKGSPGTSQAAKFTDRKAVNVNGGASGSTGAVTVTRTLNTTEYNTAGASLSSNQIVLLAGTYDVWGRAPSYNASSHRALLWNVSTSTVALLGSNAYSGIVGGANTQNDSVFSGRLVLASAQLFEVRHFLSSPTNNSLDLGISSGYGLGEIYTEVTIVKAS